MWIFYFVRISLRPNLVLPLPSTLEWPDVLEGPLQKARDHGCTWWVLLSNEPKTSILLLCPYTTHVPCWRYWKNNIMNYTNRPAVYSSCIFIVYSLPPPPPPEIQTWKLIHHKYKWNVCMHNGPMHNFFGNGNAPINWRAPCKAAPSDYFLAIFQVAPNRLKFGMSTLFVLKNVPVFFSTSGEARLQTHSWKFTPCPSRTPPPPPQSPSNSVKDTCTVFWPSKIEILCCLETDREGGGEGVEFDAILSIFFCILEKKHRDIF